MTRDTIFTARCRCTRLGQVVVAADLVDVVGVVAREQDFSHGCENVFLTFL